MLQESQNKQENIIAILHTVKKNVSTKKKTKFFDKWKKI